MILRWRLRIAARAFTCFWKTLAQEIPGSFLHLSIQGVAHWMTYWNTWNCTVLGEADCKDQFNRILPSDVPNHFQQATEWLRSQRRWRATQMFWSVHKYDKRLDRCGKASAYNFDILSHSELTELITFCLQDGSFCQGAGTCWSRAFALPMGGPFSAQVADLRSLWCFHLQKQRFDVLGELRSTDVGYPIWVSSTGRVIALAQFKDNILVSAKGPGASWAMSDVCLLVQHAWSLRVLCPCINDHVSDCYVLCDRGIVCPWDSYGTATWLGHCVCAPLNIDIVVAVKTGCPFAVLLGCDCNRA